MAVLRVSQVLSLGLKYAGANLQRYDKSRRFNKWVQRFKSCYGLHPLVCTVLWCDLKNHGIDTEHNLERFFMSLYWMKNYDAESVLAVIYNLDEETVRVWCWYYSECLQELSYTKVNTQRK